MNGTIETIEDGVIFTLATGEKISVKFNNDVMGTEGYELLILCHKDQILVQPSASNSIIATTIKAVIELESKVREVVRKRKEATGR